MSNLIMVTGLEANILYGIDLETQERVSVTVTAKRTEDWFAALNEAVLYQQEHLEDAEEDDEQLVMIVTKNEFYKEEV